MKIVSVILAMLLMVGIGAATSSTLGAAAIQIAGEKLGYAVTSDKIDNGYNVVFVTNGDNIVAAGTAVGAVAFAMVNDGYDAKGMSAVGVLDSRTYIGRTMILTEKDAITIVDSANAGTTDGALLVIDMWNNALVKDYN